MGYLVGFHAMWVVLGEVLGVALAWTVVARPFKEFTDRYNAITVPDYLADRFKDRGHALRIVSAVIIFTMVVAYTAAQLVMSGKAFSSFIGTSYLTGVLIGAAVILVYTSVGGFKAVAYSDLVQGVLMFLCLLLLPIAGIWHAGGWSALVAGIGQADPALLRPMGAHGFSLAGVVSAVSFAGIGLAFLGAPQLLTRFMSARDRRQIPRGGVIAVACIVVFDVGAVLAGIAGTLSLSRAGRPRDRVPGHGHGALPGGGGRTGAGGRHRRDHVHRGLAADPGLVGGDPGRRSEDPSPGPAGPGTVGGGTDSDGRHRTGRTRLRPAGGGTR